MSEQAKTNRQITRSRRLLQEAFLSLLAEKPFRKVSISEIAERADLARSTFYAHFDTKQDLLASYVDDIFDPFLQTILVRGTVPDEANAEELKLQSSVCRLWRENRQALSAIKDSGQELLILERLEVIHKTIYREVIKKTRPHLGDQFGEFITSYVAHVYFGILMKWLEHNFKPADDVIAQILYEFTGPPKISDAMDELNYLFNSPF